MGGHRGSLSLLVIWASERGTGQRELWEAIKTHRQGRDGACAPTTAAPWAGGGGTREGRRAEAATATPFVGRVRPTCAEQRRVVWLPSRDSVGEGG